jgi:Tfp pilus assembly protein PilZ
LIYATIFCHSQKVMRLLAEILIIAALIFFGWNKPFKEQVAQANTTITNKLHGVGSKLQKHQDPSVRRH